MDHGENRTLAYRQKAFLRYEVYKWRAVFLYQGLPVGLPNLIIYFRYETLI